MNRKPIQRYASLGLFGAAGLSFSIGLYYFIEHLVTQNPTDELFSSSAKMYSEYFLFYQSLNMMYLFVKVGLVLSAIALIFLPVRGRSLAHIVNITARKIVIFSATVLQVYFLWTSDALIKVGVPFKPFELGSLVIVDILCGILAISLLTFSYISTHSVIATIGNFSLVLIPLGLEVYLFNRADFGLYVISSQGYYNILTWFTNADLLVLSSVMFASCLILRVLKYD